MRARPDTRSRRRLFTLGDQLVSSLSNIVLLLIVARSVSGEQLGAFVLIMTLHQTACSVGQMLVGEPFVVLSSDDGPESRPARAASALGTALLIGAGIGMPIAIIAIIGLDSAALATLAVCLPGLLLQDGVRYVAFGLKRPGAALASDTLWAVLATVGSIWLTVTQTPSVAGLVAVWAISGTVAGIAGGVFLRTLPRVSTAAQWLRGSKDLGWRFLAESFVARAQSQIVLFVCGGVIGLAAAGYLRLAQAVFNPIHVAVSAYRVVALVDFSAKAVKRESLRELVRRGTWVLGAGGAVWTVVLLALPAAAGSAVFGTAWVSVAPLIALVGLYKISQCTAISPYLALRSMRLADLTLRTRTSISVAGLVVTCGIAVVAQSLQSVLIAQAATSILGSVAWHLLFRRAERARFRQVPGELGQLRCAVVSHAYLEPEYAKNLESQGQLCQLTWITARRHRTLGFRQTSLGAGTPRNYTVRGFRALTVRPSDRYLLLSVDMGLRRVRPHVVIVEYQPWSMIAMQVRLYTRIYCPDACLVFSVKKNTFRPYPRYLAAYKRWAVASLMQRTSHIMAASEMTRDLLLERLQIPEHRITVVPHRGLDTETFAPTGIGAGTDSVAYVGKLTAAKGVDLLINAVRAVRAEGDRDIRLELLGPIGKADPDILALALDTDWVTLHEARPNSTIPEFLAGSSLFVMPSRAAPDHEEHDGRALFEAMSCGLVCVGSEVGVIPELLRGGRGYLFARDSLAGLTAALRAALENNHGRRRSVELARHHILTELSLDAVAMSRIGCAYRTQVELHVSS